MNPFVPGSTLTISVTNTTGTAILTVPNASSYLLTNAGTALAFFRAGGSDVVATTADTPILPSQSKVIDLKSSAGRNGCTHIAAITGTSTATLYVTAGQGGI